MEPSKDQGMVPVDKAPAAKQSTDTTTTAPVKQEQSESTPHTDKPAESTNPMVPPSSSAPAQQLKAPATQSQPATLTRDHYNFQSLGLSLNTAVKKVEGIALLLTRWMR